VFPRLTRAQVYGLAKEAAAVISRMSTLPPGAPGGIREARKPTSLWCRLVACASEHLWLSREVLSPLDPASPPIPSISWDVLVYESPGQGGHSGVDWVD
jgi:hypothetical protein